MSLSNHNYIETRLFTFLYPVVVQTKKPFCNKLLYLVAFPHHSYADDDPRLPLAGAQGIVVGLVVEVRGAAALRCGGRGGRRRRRGGGRGRGKSSRELGHIFISGSFMSRCFTNVCREILPPLRPRSPRASSELSFHGSRSHCPLFFVFLSPPPCRRKAQCLAKIERGD